MMIKGAASKRYVLLTLTLIAGAVAANPVTAAGNIAGDVEAAELRLKWKRGFSPGGTALDLVLDSIDHAQHEILVAAYSLTSRPVAGALRAAKKRGVSVVVVADRKANDNRYSTKRTLWPTDRRLRRCGSTITTRPCMINSWSLTAAAVLTGWFNFSASDRQS
ncbi:phospholipase D-like domain-containing protein (plasmid) [Escherichia coli]